MKRYQSTSHDDKYLWTQQQAHPLEFIGLQMNLTISCGITILVYYWLVLRLPAGIHSGLVSPLWFWVFQMSVGYDVLFTLIQSHYPLHTYVKLVGTVSWCYCIILATTLCRIIFREIFSLNQPFRLRTESMQVSVPSFTPPLGQCSSTVLTPY